MEWWSNASIDKTLVHWCFIMKSPVWASDSDTPPRAELGNHHRILPTIFYLMFTIITSPHWVLDNHWIIIIFIIYHFMIYYWKGLKLFSLPSFTKKWDPPWVSQIASPIMVLCWTWANDLGAKWPNWNTNFLSDFPKWLQEKIAWTFCCGNYRRFQILIRVSSKKPNHQVLLGRKISTNQKSDSNKQTNQRQKVFLWRNQ